MKYRRILILVTFSLFLPLVGYAQFPETERRIYILDVTASMEGGGTVKTDNIFNALKDSLIAAISTIEDYRTEIFIIPFTNVVHDGIYGTIGEKDSLIREIKKLKIKKGDTNIADAWTYGLNMIDSSQANYMFLLTDGLHNFGPSKEEFYERLRQWPSFSRDKYAYAFYVMLTDNAQDREIDEIADENANMWSIKSMNINAAFIGTSKELKINVHDNNILKICFSSNNSHFSVKDAGICIELADTTYYSLGKLEPCEVDTTATADSSKHTAQSEYFMIPIISKRPVIEMPVEYDTQLKLSHTRGTDSLYFVFMTPEIVDFHISNSGIREAYVEDAISGNPVSGDINLGVITVKRNSTGALRSSFFVRFNDESVRHHSYIKLKMIADHNNGSDSLMNSTFKGRLVAASSGRSTVSYLVNTRSNVKESTRLTGKFVAEVHDIDRVNGEDASTNMITICRWYIDVDVEPAAPWAGLIIPLAIAGGMVFGIRRSIASEKKNPQINNGPDEEEKEEKRKKKRKKKCPCDKKLWTFCKVLTDNSALLSDKCCALVSQCDNLDSLPDKERAELLEKICERIRPLVDGYRNIDKPVPDHNGVWEGKEGSGSFSFDDTYIPKSTQNGMAWKELVAAYKRDFNLDVSGGVRYENGRIDLSPYAIAKTEICFKDLCRASGRHIEWSEVLRNVAGQFQNILQQTISDEGYIDFQEFLDGKKNGITVRDTPLIIHEGYDGRTFMLVPKYLHDNWPHFQGARICQIIGNEKRSYD